MKNLIYCSHAIITLVYFSLLTILLASCATNTNDKNAFTNRAKQNELQLAMRQTFIVMMFIIIKNLRESNTYQYQMQMPIILLFIA